MPQDETERLRARLRVHESLLSVLATARDTPEAASRLLEFVAAQGPWAFGALWIADPSEGVLRRTETWTSGSPEIVAFAKESSRTVLAKGEGLPGEVWMRGKAHWCPDIAAESRYPRSAAASRAGLHAALAVPSTADGEFVAVLELMAPHVGDGEPEALDLLHQAGDYLGLFIQRARAESQRRHESLLRAAIMDAALDAIITIDAAGRIVDFNRAAESIFGYARHDVIGGGLSEKIVPPEHRASHAAGMARYLATGEAHILGRRVEITAMRSDGSTFPVELTVVRIDDPAGKPLFTAYLRDITERREWEARLAGHAGELARQHRQKDAFLAVLAHELRNPLAPIANALQLMRLTGPGETNAALPREVIERQVRNLTRLVEDLIDVSRVSRGTISLRLGEVALRQLVDDAVELSMPLIRGRNHVLTIEPPAEATFVADATRVVQVLSNLLNNAAKYTPEGGQIFLSATTEGDEVVLRVRDTGVGIALDAMQGIFEMFVQGPESAKQGGLGVGLALTKAIVELHGGRLIPHSLGIGHGSTFEVRLPRHGPGTR